MTEKTEMVRVPRELLERLQLALSTCYCPETSVTTDLWKLLAAPAEDVRAVVEEPVPFGYWRVPNEAPLQGMFLLWDENTSEGVIKAWESRFNFTKLYRHPQRPVVLPERSNERDHAGDFTYEAKARNACIDEFKRLNK